MALGNFTVGQNVVINSQCNNIQVNDLNKDGNLDLVLAGAGSENGTGLFISSYLGDGAGNFTVQQVIDLGDGRHQGRNFARLISTRMATWMSPIRCPPMAV